MADPLFTVAATLREAFAAVTGLPAAEIDAVVRSSDRADAQANGALALAKQAAVVIVVKGKKVVRIDMQSPPSDDALADLLLGPSGNLRAPSLRRGKTLLVGFDPATYSEVLGGRDAR